MDWLSALKIRTRQNSTDQARAGQIGGDTGTRQVGIIELRPSHLCGDNIGFPQARMAQIGIQEPRLVQDGTVELGTDKLGLIETCSSQSDAREVEFRQVEAGQSFTGEIGLVGSECDLDIRTRQIRRDHVR